MTTETADLEQILLQLLAPDNNTIVKATAQLKSIVQDPAIVPALCTILVTSAHMQVRQYAAILLRRKVLKTKQWNALPMEVTLNMRTNILQILLSEPVKAVRKAVAQLIATVAKHELAQAKWPELFEFIYRYAHSNVPDQRELGMFVLSQVTSTAAAQLRPSLLALLELCASTMNDNSNHLVAFHALQTLTDLVALIGDDELKVFQGMIPNILQVITYLISIDEDIAVESMDILDELVESEVSVIVPHIKTVIDFCLQIGSNRELGNGVRIKALSFVSWLTRLKKKSITKLQLTEPILNVLFSILSEATSDEELATEEDSFDDAQTAAAFAASVIDVISQNLPPDRFVQPLLRLVEPALQSSDPNRRQAAFVALAVSCEGCADHMKHRYIDTLMQYVHQGLTDPCTMVKNVTLFAIGQFSEHLQPDITKYSKDLLPVLFNYLNHANVEMAKDTRGVTKTYYALEMFCENLGKEILPYLPQLMRYLLMSLQTSPSLHTKALAISAIGATANAAEEDLVPYFPQIIDELNKFLNPTESEDEIKVQLQALDTLGVLARTIKKEHFMPLVNRCIQLGLTLLQHTTDPDLKRCVYGLFAAISTLLKADMQPCLSTIIAEMLESVKSTDGLTPHYPEEESRIFHIFDEDVEDGDDEADSELEGLSVENAYLQEKADACSALGELALETKSAFLPFVEGCFNEITKLLDYPAVSIRKNAISAVAQFCCTVGEEVALDPSSHDAHAVLHSMLTKTMPKFLTVVMFDAERQVAMTTLEMINKLLQQVGTAVVNGDGMLDGILSVVKNVMQHKTASQDEGEEDLEDEEAEYDLMLVENAGEVIPSVAKVVGGQTFAPYLAGLLPELLKRMKTNATTAEKSFAVGTLAETIVACGATSAVFAQHLYPVFVRVCQEEDEEVRSNAVFAIGVLAANSGETMYSNYADIVKKLFNILNHETDGKVIDNIAAVFCRLIKTNIACVSVAQVLPVVLQCLPLKSDFEENATIYPCLVQLYYNADKDLLRLLPKVLNIVAQVIDSENLTEELRDVLRRLLEDIAAKYPSDLQTVISALPETLGANLQKYCGEKQPV